MKTLHERLVAARLKIFADGFAQGFASGGPDESDRLNGAIFASGVRFGAYEGQSGAASRAYAALTGGGDGQG